MKKTIEVEYVGIEDVQEIMDDALAVMREGNYVLVSMSGEKNTLITVSIKVGGYNEKPADYSYAFFIDDCEASVNEMNKCKATLKNLLVGVDE